MYGKYWFLLASVGYIFLVISLLKSELFQRYGQDVLSSIEDLGVHPGSPILELQTSMTQL